MPRLRKKLPKTLESTTTVAQTHVLKRSRAASAVMRSRFSGRVRLRHRRQQRLSLGDDGGESNLNRPGYSGYPLINTTFQRDRPAPYEAVWRRSRDAGIKNGFEQIAHRIKIAGDQPVLRRLARPFESLSQTSSVKT